MVKKIKTVQKKICKKKTFIIWTWVQNSRSFVSLVQNSRSYVSLVQNSRTYVSLVQNSRSYVSLVQNSRSYVSLVQNSRSYVSLVQNSRSYVSHDSLVTMYTITKYQIKVTKILLRQSFCSQLCELKSSN
jgi:hypothetical protein